MLVETVFVTGVHTLGGLLLGLFTTARVLLWAFLVATAWFEIVEKPFQEEQQLRSKKPKSSAQTPIELTATTLQQHDAAEAVYQLEHPQRPQQQASPLTAGRRWPAHIPPMAGVSEMGDDESVDQWSIWDEGGHRHENGHHTTPEGFPAEPIPSTINHPRQPVAVNGATTANGAPGRTPYHGPRPADHDEAHVLAVSTLAGNTDLIKEPGKEAARHGPGGKKHGEKKPLFSRKIEKWFIAPYAQKYERMGYFMYKSFNKVGLHLETSVNNLSKDLDSSIREAGVEAVNRVEVVMRRYMKFFGAVVLLTVVLVPLPSVHVSVGVA